MATFLTSSMHRFKGIWGLIFLFLFLLANAVLCAFDVYGYRSGSHTSSPAPQTTQTTATTTPSVDTTNWPTYTDPETGISFKYPTFGQPARVVKEMQGTEGAFSFDIEFFDQPENQWWEKYDVFVASNPDRTPLLTWFSQVVDLGGYIVAQHAYDLKTLPNGIKVLVLGKIPPEHDGSVPDMYAISPSLDQIFAIQTTQEGGVTVFTSVDNLHESYLALLSSMEFKNDWQQATLEGITVSYPSTFKASVQPEYHSINLLDKNMLATAPEGTEIPSIDISIDKNPDHLSLSNYYDGQHGSLLDGFVGTTTVAGLAAYGYTPLETEAGEYAVVAQLSSGDFLKVADVGAAFEQNGEFEQILSRIKIAP